MIINNFLLNNFFGISFASQSRNRNCFFVLYSFDNFLFYGLGNAHQLNFFRSDFIFERALFINNAGFLQVFNHNRCNLWRNFFLNFFFLIISQANQHTQFKYAKLNAGFSFNFGLQFLSKLGKTLICHHVQNVDVFIFNTFTILINA